MSLLGLNLGLLREGLLLLGHLSIRGPLLPTPPQVEVRQVQANVENQMLMVTSDSQKRRGQVAFLSVRVAHPALSPGFPSALHQAGRTLRAWSGWCGSRLTVRVSGPALSHDNKGTEWGSEMTLYAPSPPPPPEIDPDNMG